MTNVPGEPGMSTGMKVGIAVAVVLVILAIVLGVVYGTKKDEPAPAPPAPPKFAPATLRQAFDESIDKAPPIMAPCFTPSIRDGMAQLAGTSGLKAYTPASAMKCADVGLQEDPRAADDPSATIRLCQPKGFSWDDPTWQKKADQIMQPVEACLANILPDLPYNKTQPTPAPTPAPQYVPPPGPPPAPMPSPSGLAPSEIPFEDVLNKTLQMSIQNQPQFADAFKACVTPNVIQQEANIVRQNGYRVMKGNLNNCPAGTIKTGEYSPELDGILCIPQGSQWPPDESSSPVLQQSKPLVQSVMDCINARAQPPPQTPVQIGATFYSDCNFGGQSRFFPQGEYSRIEAAGFPNDALSSIKINQGTMITLYENSNFQGASWEIGAPNGQSIDCLINNGWNDKVSSFRIKPMY